MVQFLGSSKHRLDDKGRLILPSRVLDLLPKAEHEFVLTAGFEPCLLLMDMKAWGTLVSKFGDQVLVRKAERSLRRRFLGMAEIVKPDGSKRVRVPEALRTYAGIDAESEVVLLGSGSTVEIWSPTALNKAFEPSASTEDEEAALFANEVDSGVVAPASSHT